MIEKVSNEGSMCFRNLSHRIVQVGLLPAGNHQQVPFAYKMYMKDDPEGENSGVALASILTHVV